MKIRDLYWEKVRGICIFAVVFIHSRTGIEFNIQDSLQWNYHYWLISKELLICPVAIFLFISGYFASNNSLLSGISGGKQKFIILNYYKGRIKRLLIPYILWTILYTVFNIVVFKIELSWSAIVRYFVLGSAASHLYFIVILLQLAMLAPILIKYCNTWFCKVGIGVITIIYLTVIYVYQFYTKTQLPYREVIFTGWILFYSLGIWYRSNEYKIKGSIIKAFVLVCTALILSIIETYTFLKFGLPESLATSFFKLSSFLYAISLLYLIVILKNSYKVNKGNALSHLGGRSYGIYFVHIIVLIVTNKVASITLSELVNYLPVYHLITILVTLVISYGIIDLTRKILEDKSSIIGF